MGFFCFSLIQGVIRCWPPYPAGGRDYSDVVWCSHTVGPLNYHCLKIWIGDSSRWRNHISIVALRLIQSHTGGASCTFDFHPFWGLTESLLVASSVFFQPGISTWIYSLLAGDKVAIIIIIIIIIIIMIMKWYQHHLQGPHHSPWGHSTGRRRRKRESEPATVQNIIIDVSMIFHNRKLPIIACWCLDENSP